MTKHKKQVEEMALPDGVAVGEKPSNIELFCRGRGKWVPIVEKLRTLKSTESIRYDLTTSSDMKKAKSAIVAGLRGTAVYMGEKRILRSALMGNILHVWLK